eukprot:CAMPEP_0119121844 /NCGR_PEP_ID=MMETSP1310-20130426/2274_1 /TAXON_ID=464262 /ORGANISM="Genus nov. species nov., Strain RCC2339" /LENGTH=516 /DNA_ID=CAMNT_0007111425 /DNA_START=80 /DNA_END=1630 /DNA_ORIENTATION=+
MKGAVIMLLMVAGSASVLAQSFSYDPESPVGPESWGEVDVRCDGGLQSPINIVRSEATLSPADDLETSTRGDILFRQPVVNRVRSLKVEVEEAQEALARLEGSTLYGETYTLYEIDYHMPSEHTIDGTHYDLEVQYKHRNAATGRLAYVAIMYNADGVESQELEYLVPYLDQIPNVDDFININVQLLYPTVGEDFYHYSGSGTTPPCEPVEWFVYKSVQSCTQAQLDEIKPRLDSDGFDNIRPIQPTNGRQVYDYPNQVFSYDPTDVYGPDNWDTFFPACGGERQSPINIDSSEAVEYEGSVGLVSDALDQDSSQTVTNEEHSLVVTVVGSDAPTLQGYSLLANDYEMVQYQTHSPAEHSIDGFSYDFEVQYMHRLASTGGLSAVSILYRLGDCNAGLQSLVDAVDSITNVGDSTTVDVNLLIPVNGSFWHYQGSLTTPPCTENVEWYVLTRVQEVCSVQLDALQSVQSSSFSSNNRPVQPLNGRTIFFHSPAAARIAPTAFLGLFALLAILLTLA